MKGTEMDIEQSRANARLIAAAPEMYEALDLMIDVLRTSEPNTVYGRIGPVVDKARAALAKAEGK